MILSFMRGWPKWTPPTLASVNMIEAKTIKELLGNYLLLLKTTVYMLYEATEIQITAKIVLSLC